jgi:hypothetical protein
MIEANGSADFLRAMIAVFAERVWVRIFALQFRGKVTALILALCNETKMFHISARSIRSTTFSGSGASFWLWRYDTLMSTVTHAGTFFAATNTISFHGAPGRSKNVV